MDTKEAPPFVIEDNIIKGRKLPSLQEERCLNEILLDNLKENPDFVGQIDALTGEICTYKKLADMSVRCAIWLKKQGIGSGDIISICTNNNITSLAPFCATFYIGANLNPWYYDWSPATARYFVNLTKPKVIFADEHAGKMLKEVFSEENIESKIIIFGKVAGLKSFDDIINEQSADEVEKFQVTKVNPDDDALMLFSSGSTGLPKGVQHSYRGVHYNIYRFSCIFDDTEKMVLLCTSTLYWISGALCTLQSLMYAFPVIIVNSTITPKELCKTIEKFKVQLMFLGTGITNELFISDSLTKFDLSSIKCILIGGSKVRPEVLNRISSILKNGEILQAYGLTELGGLGIMQQRGQNHDNNRDSCGTVPFDIELKIVDINSKEILGPNQKGEILLKQRYMMKYYFQNRKATEESIDNEGWLHTGDSGYYDDEGNIYVNDRIKEVIKYRGHHISPEEIESILFKHQEILDAAVVATPHPLDDEHPIAFVVKMENSQVSKDELMSLTSVLGDTKKLRGGIIFLEKLPQTPTGKINRSKLKEMAKSMPLNNK